MAEIDLKPLHRIVRELERTLFTRFNAPQPLVTTIMGYVNQVMNQARTMGSSYGQQLERERIEKLLGDLPSDAWEQLHKAELLAMVRGEPLPEKTPQRADSEPAKAASLEDL